MNSSSFARCRQVPIGPTFSGTRKRAWWGTISSPSLFLSRAHHDLSQVELVDFGATRSYSSASINNWLRLLLAAAQQDREGCLRSSLKLGYFTGEENDVGCHSPPSVLRKVLIDWVDYIMNNAHVESLQLLATPFREDTPQPFTFGLV
jgi:hypothetical protein